MVVIYIILGVLYESLIHPITILSTLPSAGIGALLLLMAVHMDLSVIAIIGIILLIGIVKKNGIMLVDFALEVERSEGLGPEESIYQACVLRFRPILMTTMAATARRRAADARHRRRFGNTPAARLYHRRRLDRVATPDAVYDAGRLSLSRQAGSSSSADFVTEGILIVRPVRRQNPPSSVHFRANRCLYGGATWPVLSVLLSYAGLAAQSNVLAFRCDETRSLWINSNLSF